MKTWKQFLEAKVLEGNARLDTGPLTPEQIAWMKKMGYPVPDDQSQVQTQVQNPTIAQKPVMRRPARLMQAPEPGAGHQVGQFPPGHFNQKK